MARYSRRSGPPANFELTATPTLITGLTLTRFFDEGELLISAQVEVGNATGVTITPFITVTVDGVTIPGIRGAPNIATGFRGAATLTTIVPIAAGMHTINVLGQGDAIAGDTAVANLAQLTVIQLPQWDQDTDIA